MNDIKIAVTIEALESLRAFYRGRLSGAGREEAVVKIDALDSLLGSARRLKPRNGDVAPPKPVDTDTTLTKVTQVRT
jgi:hypothetical protein